MGAEAVVAAASRYTLVAGRLGVRIVRDTIPVCGPTEVLLRVRYSLVSAGTETHYVTRSSQTGDTLALGYCVVGRVVQGGSAVDGVVAGDTAIGMGWTIATHSDYVLVPRKLVCRVDPGLEPERALLATLGATAVHAADRAALVAGDRVLVVGMGPVGMLVSMVAADRGCAVWAWDRDPERLRDHLFWRELDPFHPADRRLAMTAIFVCIDGNVSTLFPALVALLDPTGNGVSRSRIVNVGRIAGTIALSPATGNVDLINVSRCGAGYRDEDYHHGLRGVPVPGGEQTVDANLRRCLNIVAAHRQRLGGLEVRLHTPEQAVDHFNAGSFPPGLNLIDHGS